MTEYDYSPAAHQAYKAKLKQIAKWTSNVPACPELLANPFVPSANGENDFYAPSSSRRKLKKSTRRSTRGGGYWSDGDGSESDNGGPGRAPTPPVSSLATGMGFYGSPYYQPQCAAVAPSVSSNLLIPVWNGSSWSYQPASTTCGVYSASLVGSPGLCGDMERGRGREKSRKKSLSRPKPHRRDSHIPAASSGSYLGAPNTNTYPAAMHLSLDPYSPSLSSSQWTSRSAPLPLPNANGAPPAGYFSPQSRQPQSRFPQHQVYSPQSMKVIMSSDSYQFKVQSAASVQSGYASLQSQPMGYGYGYVYADAIGQQPVYGNRFDSGLYGGGYGVQPPVIIVDSAKEKKAPKSSRTRSLFGRLTGGM